MSLYKKIMPIAAPLLKAYHRMRIQGEENLPPVGRGFIIAANHSNWFGWDALAISAAALNREIHWISWSYEEEFPAWNAMVRAFSGILYDPKQGFPYKQIADEILRPGGIVGIFPEGNNNLVGNWYRLRPFFPGCIRLAVLAGVPVVPAAVAGLEEASPIFHAKENENEPITGLVALPVILPTRVTVCFGAPVTPELKESDLENRDALNAASEKIQAEVLALLKPLRPRARAETFESKMK